MKRNVLITVLAVLLGLSLLGCQKEQVVAPQCNSTAYKMDYSIDGNIQQTVISDSNELNDFILNLMSYVKNSHVVVISSDSHNHPAVPGKGVVTFRTTSDTAAAAWATEKYLQGYTVTVSFDTTTNEFVCRAETRDVSYNTIPTSLVGTKWVWQSTNDTTIRVEDMFYFDTDSTGFYSVHIFEAYNQPDSYATAHLTYVYDPERGSCSASGEYSGEDSNTVSIFIHVELHYDMVHDALVQDDLLSHFYSREI